MIDTHARGDDGSRWPLAIAFFLYLAFVVYGSLVPFEVRDLTWEQAVAGFRGIEFLDLQVVSRADWIANIVLYVPLAFLGCAALLGMRRVGWSASLGVALVGAFCLAVAVAVEFTQQWFAPRTVSLNDLIAESIGIAIGLALWVFGRAPIAALADAFRWGGRDSIAAALVGYGVVYLLLALFPYDFLVSAQELRWKLEGGNQGWLVAPGCGDPLRCAARLTLDALAVAPIGLFAALLWPRLSLGRLFTAGILIGLVLEPIQLLLASGTSQGASILLRGLGVAGGGLVGGWLRRVGPRPVARAITLAGPLLLLPYVAGLALVTGWFSVPALPLDAALARLPEVRWLPLYYHYFTTEPVAVASTLAHLALYAPFGLWFWALAARRGGTSGAQRVWLVAAVTLAVAVVIEGGKLFFPPKHPDPTNLLVAVAGALLAHGLARWFERALTGGLDSSPGQTRPARGWDAPLAEVEPEGRVMQVRSPMDEAPPPAAGTEVAADLVAPAPSHPGPALRPIGVALGVAAAVPLVVGVLSFPLAWPVLAVLLALYGALLWVQPLAWLLILPILLPVLDLSPVTGRLPLDAFDLTVLATLTVGYARNWGAPRSPWPSPLFPLALALLWASWLISTARGLWPLLAVPWPPADGSHSPLEAWMVAKGMLWAMLLVPLLRRVPRDRLEQAKDLFAQGVVIGLALVAVMVLWERHVFVGLWDFDNVFRVTGPFANMHTGGAYIEAFLAFAFPFLAVGVIAARSWWGRGLGVLTAALVSYAMMVTFSRGGWVGLAAGLAVVLIGILRGRVGRPGWVAAGVLMIAVAGAAVPVLTGGFAQERLARSLEDLEVRIDHWSRALSLMSPGAVPVLVGEGFGQYPLAYLLLADVDRLPGTFAILEDGGNPYLRLGSGETVFLDQRVAVEPGQTYRLSARVRLPGGDAVLEMPLCEKALLYSFQCVEIRVEPGDAGGDWRAIALEMQSGRLGAGGNWPHPPVKLALHNAGPAQALDLDDLSLKTSDGRELIANGGFSDGARRWLFVTDQDLAWHIHEQWVEIYFAQGVLGVLALLLALWSVGMALRTPFREADPFAVGLSAALVGILAVGLLGSVLDTARIAVLVYLASLLPVGLLPGQARRRRRRRSGKRHGHSGRNAESGAGRRPVAES